jgi:hypothetical protein
MGKKRLNARTENISPIWANTFRSITEIILFTWFQPTARVLRRFPCPQSEMEVDNREATIQTTEKRRNMNTVQSNTACSIFFHFYLSAIQTSCCTQFSFENTHFAAYLRFHPRRTALHDLSWVSHYLTIMYQLHTLLSVDDAY